MTALSDDLKVLKLSKLLGKFNVSKHVEKKIESVSLNLTSILPRLKFGKQIAPVQNFKNSLRSWCWHQSKTAPSRL